jgi:small-conductance mechanosensitive channel
VDGARPGPSSRARRAAAPALAALVLAAQAWAAPPPAGRTPQPIPAAQIPARANAAETLARAASERAQSDRTAAQFGPEFAALDASLEWLRGRPDMQRLDRVPAIRLEALKRQWSFYAWQLDALDRRLARRAGALSGAAAELADLEAQWRATAGAAQAEALPPALRARAEEVAAALGEALRLQGRPLGDALALQAQVSSDAQRIARARRQVDEAFEEADQRLFELDAPPLWSPSVAEAGDGPTAIRSLDDERRFIREYFAASTGLVRAYAAIALALFVLVAWLRRLSRDWLAAEGDLRDTARLLLRPWSAWLLLALLAAAFTFTRAPGAVSELLLLALVLPLLRLLPGWLAPGARAGLWAISGLFVVDRLRYLAGDGWTWRISLLAVSGVGALALAWLARRSPGDAGGLPGPWRRVAAAAAATGALLLAVAAASNAFGNLTLAALLTRATITATFEAVLLFGGATVLRGLIALLLSTRLAKRLRMFDRHGTVAMRVARRLVAALAVGAWLYATLQGFRLWSPIADAASAAFGASWKVGDLEVSAGAVLLFLVSVYGAFKLAQFVRFVIDEEFLTRVEWPRGVESAISTLSYYAVAALGVLAALSVAGVEIGKLAIVAGALGVGIGFGLQNVVNNFVSGLILMFERPIQPGDIVEVAGVQGTVKAIGMRATTLSTFDGAEVIVPNGTLLQGNLVNWTLSDFNRRIEIPVGVAYGTDPARVLSLLAEVAARQPEALRQPEPVALFVGFGDSALNFSLRFWTAAGDRWTLVRSRAMVDVASALAAAGIEIPFPQRDLNLKNVAPEAARAFARPGAPAEPAR